MRIAADSGYEHFVQMDVGPDLLIGDMDSIAPSALSAARQGQIRIETYPAEKDFTDTELALRMARERGEKCVVACAVWGNRVDHSLANLLLPASATFEDMDIRLLIDGQEIRAVRNCLMMHTLPGEIVSIIPVSGIVKGVTTQGLYYPLTNARLETGPALGVSNVAIGNKIEVRVESGTLLVTRIFEGGLNASRYLAEELS